MELMDELPGHGLGKKKWRRRNLRFAEEAEILRENPGKWMRIATASPYPGAYSGLLRGSYRAFTPRTSYEFASRAGFTALNEATGKLVRYCDVYARYIGENGEYGTENRNQFGRKAKRKQSATSTEAKKQSEQDTDSSSAAGSEQDPYEQFYNDTKDGQ